MVKHITNIVAMNSTIAETIHSCSQNKFVAILFVRTIHLKIVEMVACKTLTFLTSF